MSFVGKVDQHFLERHFARLAAVPDVFHEALDLVLERAVVLDGRRRRDHSFGPVGVDEPQVHSLRVASFTWSATVRSSPLPPRTRRRLRKPPDRTVRMMESGACIPIPGPDGRRPSDSMPILPGLWRGRPYPPNSGSNRKSTDMRRPIARDRRHPRFPLFGYSNLRPTSAPADLLPWH